MSKVYLKISLVNLKLMSIVKKYNVKIISIERRSENVYTLEFRSMEKPFVFEAGQFLHLAIDNADFTEQWPESRCFSIQSSPNDENIRITYSVKGQFTVRMKKELTVGKKITLKLPYGELFTRYHNKSNTVFIAGGTGITPYLSLFNDISFASYINPTLYAGFQNEKMNFYINELHLAKTINPGLNVIFIYQDKQGIIDFNTILKSSKKDCSFFISGPPLMIKSFKQFFIFNGVPENKIITDDWD